MDAPGPDTTPRAATRRRLARRLDRRAETLLGAWWANQFDADRVRRHAVAGVEGLEPELARESFLRPLLGLLTAWLRTGDPTLRDLYLDERLRYAPHQAPLEERVLFFREVLPRDEEALLHAAGPYADALQSLLEELHAPLLHPPRGRPVRLLALGDCLMNEIRVFLPSRARRHGVELDMRCLYFSGLLGRALSDEALRALLEKASPDLVAASFLTYEATPSFALLLRQADRLSAAEVDREVQRVLDPVRRFLYELRKRNDAPVLLHNASGLPLSRLRGRLPILRPLSPARRRVVERLNTGIREIVDDLPNGLLMDEWGIVQAHGHRASSREVAPRRLARRALFHTTRLGDLLTGPYLEVVQAFERLRRAKVLLVDFDNTLWDGVMADGPVRHRRDVQRLLRQLREAGMLLVALSRNDPRNIRWDEMDLGPEDFVLHKISWDLKVQSVRAVARELDLGVESFVLVDDSAAEREMVRRELPEVMTLDATDPRTWLDLERLLAFPNTGETEEARRRTDLYRERAHRIEALCEPVDYPELMRGLGLRATFGRAAHRDLDRVAELIQRTNQFNTTTIRYSRGQLECFLEAPDRRVYVAELADKFGSQGLVGVVIVERRGEDALLDSFVMSCRAMGFEFERLLLSLVVAEEEDARRWIGRFVPTDRNGPASALYPGCGFTELEEGLWVLEAGAARPEVPPWFAVRRRGERS